MFVAVTICSLERHGSYNHSLFVAAINRVRQNVAVVAGGGRGADENFCRLRLHARANYQPDDRRD